MQPLIVFPRTTQGGFPKGFHLLCHAFPTAQSLDSQVSGKEPSSGLVGGGRMEIHWNHG